MTRLILPHPNPPYFRENGQLNANGQLRLFESGTATPKIAYSDASGTSYGSTINLDSAGLPESGPIYWATDGLYKVEVYYRVDDTPTYALDYTVDPHGWTFSAVSTDLNENLISNWSFEVVGATPPAAANWTDTGSNITRDTADNSHGAASLKFTSSSNGSDYSNSSTFEVSEELGLQLQFLLKASNASAEPAIKVFWLDDAQAAVSDEYIYRGNAGLTPTSWSLIEGLYVEPPATARYAYIQVIGNESGTSYTTNFDGISATTVPPLSTNPPAGVNPVGLNISIDSGDTEHDIEVSSGATLNSTYTTPMTLESAITKRIDAGWVVGDGQGGLFNGSTLTANGRLGVYLIKNTATGQVDFGFDDDASLSPTLPTGYDVYRYLGSITLDASSNIENGIWHGSDYVKLASPDEEISDTSISDSVLETGTINAPPDAMIRYQARCEIISGAVTEFIMQVRPTDAAWASTKFGQGMESTTDDLDENWIENEVRVDGSSQLDYGVDYNSHAGSVEFYLYLLGWTDYHRDNP